MRAVQAAQGDPSWCLETIIINGAVWEKIPGNRRYNKHNYNHAYLVALHLTDAGTCATVLSMKRGESSS